MHDVLRDAEEVQAQCTSTAPDGHYRLREPANAKPHLLVAWQRDRGCRAVDLPIDRSAPITIVLPRDPVVTGVVLDQRSRRRGRGGRASLARCRGMPISYVRADAQGRYALQPLPAGDYQFEVEHERFATAEATLSIAAGRPEQPQDFELEPLPEFRALLVDGDGVAWTKQRIERELDASPAELHAMVSEQPYARLQEVDAASWRAKPLAIDGEGHVHGFVRKPSMRVLSVWHRGDKVFEVPAVDFAATRLVVAMLPRVKIEMRVHVRLEPPPATMPAPEVRVAVTDPSSIAMNLQPLAEVTTTERMCVLTVPVNFAGRACGLLVQCSGRVPSFTILRVPENGSGLLSEVVLAIGSHRVHGTVVDPNGEPVARALLFLADQDGSWFLPPQSARGATGPDGSFAFDGVPARRVRLFVVANALADYAFAVDSTTGGPLRLELRAGQAIQVRVPAFVEAARYVVRNGAGEALADDRLSGANRYGGAQLVVDSLAASIEAYDGVTGTLIGSGAIPTTGQLVLGPPAGK